MNRLDNDLYGGGSLDSLILDETTKEDKGQTTIPDDYSIIESPFSADIAQEFVRIDERDNKLGDPDSLDKLEEKMGGRKKLFDKEREVAAKMQMFYSSFTSKTPSGKAYIVSTLTHNLSYIKNLQSFIGIKAAITGMPTGVLTEMPSANKPITEDPTMYLAESKVLKAGKEIRKKEYQQRIGEHTVNSMKARIFDLHRKNDNKIVYWYFCVDSNLGFSDELHFSSFLGDILSRILQLNPGIELIVNGFSNNPGAAKTFIEGCNKNFHPHHNVTVTTADNMMKAVSEGVNAFCAHLNQLNLKLIENYQFHSVEPDLQNREPHSTNSVPDMTPSDSNTPVPSCQDLGSNSSKGSLTYKTQSAGKRYSRFYTPKDRRNSLDEKMEAEALTNKDSLFKNFSPTKTNNKEDSPTKTNKKEDNDCNKKLEF